MKFTIALCALTLVTDVTAHALPNPVVDVAQHNPVQHTERDFSDLWKRRGGGGGGGRGGGGGGSSGSSGSSSGSSGGRTNTGSGPAPAYGGGRYYGGGATVPYKSGQRSPRGLAPLAFLGFGMLAFWPGLWLYGAYMYNYPRPYTFRNETTGQNETKPVICACDPYNVCGCDDPEDTQLLDDLVGTGKYENLNSTVITVADVNGTSTILLNGTLPNGTTAAGGTENVNAAAGLGALMQAAGYWPAIATVMAVVFIA
ncbi:hypothetical protein QBC44DRAFT_251894 [Cladorrhinum sp. PSN332]|nr:hypothetical protein QBC44DRAFT_251894 [Cladorrhinum sp. PSN332]